jgi:hypothetical protein
LRREDRETGRTAGTYDEEEPLSRDDVREEADDGDGSVVCFFWRAFSFRRARMRPGRELSRPTVTPSPNVRMSTRAVEPSVLKSKRFTSMVWGFWTANTTAKVASRSERRRPTRMGSGGVGRKKSDG